MNVKCDLMEKALLGSIDAIIVLCLAIVLRRCIISACATHQIYETQMCDAVPIR